MTDQLIAGHYTALGIMNIRASMQTTSQHNLVGQYRNGEQITVYEVYPEANGIVWGRVSSNTGTGTARFVALRVDNSLKAQLSKPLEEPDQSDLAARVARIEAWIKSFQ